MSNKTHDKDKISKAVMGRIESGEVKIRPHYYYGVVSFFGVLGGLILGLVVAYLISIVVLWLRILSADGPAYGARRNLAASSDNFPLLALALSLILIVFLVYIVRKFGALYRLRWQTALLLVILVATVIGTGISYTSLPTRHLQKPNSHYCDRFPDRCE